MKATRQSCGRIHHLMDPLLFAVGAVCTLVGLGVGWTLAAAATRRHGAEATRAQAAALAARETLFAETARRLDAADAALARLRDAADTASAEASRVREENARLSAELAHERETLPEKLSLLEDARGTLSRAFDALAGQALRQSTEEFLKLADQRFSTLREAAAGDIDTRRQAIEALVAPLRETLAKVDRQIVEAEQNRAHTGASIGALLQELGQQHQRLRGETENLVRALRTPAVRGRWGEMQLRRAVELAGLLERCDFETQPTTVADGARLRPDMVVHLPAGRSIVVDAKVPLEAYLAALDAPSDAARQALMREHARQVREHVVKLGAKAYSDQFQPSPEFVVMFLGAEAIYHAALQEDPELVEFGASRRVLLAGPMSLIGLLLVVAQGWRHDTLTESAEEIRRLGKDLYERVAKMTEHLDTVRTRLDSTVRAFNDAVGSYEGRVLVTARKFKELGATAHRDIEPVQTVDSVPRVLHSANLLGLPDEAVVDAETIDEPVRER